MADFPSAVRVVSSPERGYLVIKEDTAIKQTVAIVRRRNPRTFIGSLMSVRTQMLELAMGEAYSGSESAQPQFEDSSVYRTRWWA